MAWALLGVVVFSFSVPLTKIALEGFDPFLTATGRAAIAGARAGTAALLAFALSRGGAGGGALVADALVACAVVASSWCYVEGASVTKAMPGWQVISWVVVLALPVTLPASAVIWWMTHAHH